MGKVIQLSEPEIKKQVERDGLTATIDVYSDGEGGWLLEIVDEHWNSTCWEEPFKTAQEALEVGLKAIDGEGIQNFIGEPYKPE